MLYVILYLIRGIFGGLCICRYYQILLKYY